MKLPQQQGVNLIFQLCGSVVNGSTNCPIDITVNGHEIVKGFDPHIVSFYDMVLSVSADYLQAGDNENGFSIVDQLEGGVRLLDVRLKVKKNGSNYEFVTCHGDFGSYSGVNEYHSFLSLMDGCKQFLSSYNTEMILMSLKIDDWNGLSGESNQVLRSLAGLLATYPTTSSKNIPTLGSIRGKIHLFNRISDDLSLGTPIWWKDNTAGSFAYHNSNRLHDVYVQDQYKNLPNFGYEDMKLNLVTSAFAEKQFGV